jgi:hypothetical protein
MSEDFSVALPPSTLDRRTFIKFVAIGSAAAIGSQLLPRETAQASLLGDCQLIIQWYGWIICYYQLINVCHYPGGFMSAIPLVSWVGACP